MERYGENFAEEGVSKADAQLGARNLLVNCIGMKEGETVLLITEDPRLGYFRRDVAVLVADEVAALGGHPYCLETPRIASPKRAPEVIRRTMENADHTIFLSRLGDQLRFIDLPGPGTKTMCYALDSRFLAAEVARVPYGLTVEVLQRLQESVDEAAQWEVRCPLGTHVTGSKPVETSKGHNRFNFTVKLFPLGPFRPLLCDDANGKIVTRFLPPSATNLYEPYGVILKQPVTILIENGRIVDFEGSSEITRQVRQHYEHVGKQLNIDPFVLHSWHAGTNPKIMYPDPAEKDLERWNGIMHSHPRYAHFHSCGDYAPGEIALPIIDPTILFEGVEFWNNGRFVYSERAGIRELAGKYDCPIDAFSPCDTIGI